MQRHAHRVRYRDQPLATGLHESSSFVRRFVCWQLRYVSQYQVGYSQTTCVVRTALRSLSDKLTWCTSRIRTAADWSGGVSVVYLGGAVERTSHTRTVVRECCKGDDASQWENGKFDPLPRPNPLTDRHKKFHTWLRRGYLPTCKI